MRDKDGDEAEMPDKDAHKKNETTRGASDDHETSPEGCNEPPGAADDAPGLAGDTTTGDQP